MLSYETRIERIPSKADFSEQVKPSILVVLQYVSRLQQHHSSVLIPTISNESFHRRSSFF